MSKELKDAYGALITRYNNTKELAVDNERRSLLSALSKLENEIYVSHFETEKTNEFRKHNDEVEKRRIENIETSLQKIGTMSDTILKISEILPSDIPLYRHVIDFESYSYYYYLYKKVDGLYYEIRKRYDVVGEQKNILTLKSNKSTSDIETMLEVLQMFIIQKIKELEVEIGKYMNMDYIMAYIEKEKNIDMTAKLSEYMLIYIQFLKEFVNSRGTKYVKYYLYYNKNTRKLSYKIYGYDSPIEIATNSLYELDALSDTLNVLYEFRKKLTQIQKPAIPSQQTQIQKPAANSMFGKLFASFKTGTTKVAPSPSSGGKKASSTYKLNGEKVSILINKKKLHRSIYVKGNGNGKAKYCKINNEFVLLSKLKNKIIE
jgi:hypothetical protein